MPDQSLVISPEVDEFSVWDDVLEPSEHRRIDDYLHKVGWKFGWKSNASVDMFSFWHRHFAGNLQSDHSDPGGLGAQYDCSDELNENAPILSKMWQTINSRFLRHHKLVRCYANGAPFGSEGATHTDAKTKGSFTAIYYPHRNWNVNWGGETLLFKRDLSDISMCVYPKPNRLFVFDGTLPHVARGVSRVCPQLRITLMFKTERNYEL